MKLNLRTHRRAVRRESHATVLSRIRAAGWERVDPNTKAVRKALTDAKVLFRALHDPDHPRRVPEVWAPFWAVMLVRVFYDAHRRTLGVEPLVPAGSDEALDLTRKLEQLRTDPEECAAVEALARLADRDYLAKRLDIRWRGKLR